MNGNQYTSTTSVILNLSYSDGNGSGVSQVNIKNSSGSYSGWQPISATKSWSLPSGEGNKTVYVQYMDNMGHTSPEYSDSITLDATKPVSNYSLSPGSPDGDNSWYKSNVTVSLSATGSSGIPINAIYYKIDNGGQQTFSSSFTVSTNGNHTIEYWCVDIASNAENPHNTNCSFKIDKSSPISSVNLPLLNSCTNVVSFNVQWSGTDTGDSNINSYDVQYKVGNGLWTDWTDYMNTGSTSAVFGSNFPVTVQDGTTYYFRCRAKDNAGNIEPYPTDYDTYNKIDISLPAATVVISTTHIEGVYNNENNDPKFIWSIPSDFSGIDKFCFAINHNSIYIPNPLTNEIVEETITEKEYIDQSDGAWYFHIRSKDNAGNWGATDTYGPVKIDTISPSISIINVSKNPAKAENITVTIVASEQMSELTTTITQNGASIASVPMASSDQITWTGIYPVVYGYNGTAIINVSGKDLAGKTGIGSAGFTVDTISPTKSQISSSFPENYPFSNTTSSFTWTASTDSLSGLAGYSYALNQTENYDLDTTTETSGTAVSVTRSDGDYWFHLRAVDNAGNGSEIDRYKFIIDTSSPTFTVSSSNNPAKTGDITINVQADGKLKQSPVVTIMQNTQTSSTTITMISNDYITWIGTYNVIAGYDGIANINITGIDLADNSGTGSSSFVVDTAPPLSSITLSELAPLKTGEFQINLTITDTNNISQIPNLYYTLSDGTTSSISLTGSDKNWTGKLYIESTMPEGKATFSVSVVDAAGNIGTTIISGTSSYIDTTIYISSGGIVSNSDGTKINVQSYAVSENVNIKITEPFNSTTIYRADTKILDDKAIKLTGIYKEIKATGDNTGQQINLFDKPLTITIPYSDTDQNGILDGTNINETFLKMFYLDETNMKWVLINNSKDNPNDNNVTSEVNHLTIFTIMPISSPTSLKTVFGYPNPCYASKDRYLRISNIPLTAQNVKIYIYNIAGELVRTLEESDEIETQVGSKVGKWDGRNENNEMVASGIYIYMIKSEGEKPKTEKIAIFW